MQIKQSKEAKTIILNRTTTKAREARKITIKPSQVIGCCLLALIGWSTFIGSTYQYHLLSAILIIGATLPALSENEKSES